MTSAVFSRAWFDTSASRLTRYRSGLHSVGRCGLTWTGLEHFSRSPATAQPRPTPP